MEHRSPSKDMLEILGEYSGRSPSTILESEHLIFDLGIGDDDVVDLILELERVFDFDAMDSEWEAIETVGDLQNLIFALEGRQRPEVTAERRKQELRLRESNAMRVVALASWIVLGLVLLYQAKVVFVAWIALTVAMAGVTNIKIFIHRRNARSEWIQRTQFGRDV